MDLFGVVYLMQGGPDGDWFRIGYTTGTDDDPTSGLRERFCSERATAAWIIARAPTPRRAQIIEGRLLSEWGISGLPFHGQCRDPALRDEWESIHRDNATYGFPRAADLLAHYGIPWAPATLGRSVVRVQTLSLDGWLALEQIDWIGDGPMIDVAPGPRTEGLRQYGELLERRRRARRGPQPGIGGFRPA